MLRTKPLASAATRSKRLRWRDPESFFPTACLGLLLSALLFLIPLSPALAGAACVVAKKHGNSLAIEWVAEPAAGVQQAIDVAKQRLQQQGYGKDRYEDLFPQANSELPHAYVIIVKTVYANARGKQRTSYGCGFDAASYAEAQWAAFRDLQSYSWGWTPEKGYEVMEKFRY